MAKVSAVVSQSTAPTSSNKFGPVERYIEKAGVTTLSFTPWNGKLPFVYEPATYTAVQKAIFGET